MNLYLKISKLLMINHLTIENYFKILIMKKLLTLITLFFTILAFSPTYAGVYDDWPDEAICLWLELRPDHEGYLAENEKRKLNCFEREDFKPRKVPVEDTKKNKGVSYY